MTKIQLQEALLSGLKATGATKKQMVFVTETMTEYMLTANIDTTKRALDIEKDGVAYRWCNRHEVYEQQLNFANTKKTTVACKLAAYAWAQMGKKIKALNEELMIKATQGEDVSVLAIELNSQKEIRGGRYDIDANILQYPSVKGYDYTLAR